ncbi:Rieske 2Fe-2S domain-containing protein [Mucilaginibacter sp. Bleaf8]|uniref:QcrA and Rieske domain-containing protein n=1 Tax=Mucilaginibacter sp. Bleaf8 TaxID=2834430 RepID=UPI001BCE5CBD|nr:Rieske 2Fe-2S domain-containing protein [Mucilaginibacter sp. Bleaf8]MBS7566797.1 Rieske 2Fe-2S domain-containing protein [Mucilaginibacter sp. Bleaf8]
MDRQEFLAKFGIGIAAICAGCTFASCGSTVKDDDPTPDDGTGSNPPAGALVSADLSSELRNVGESKVANGIIIVRLASGNAPESFTAVQVACTHQGVAINYNNAQGRFVCPAHGSQFNTTGDVLAGPATSALKKYTINVNGSTLSVSS